MTIFRRHARPKATAHASRREERDAVWQPPARGAQTSIRTPPPVAPQGTQPRIPAVPTIPRVGRTEAEPLTWSQLRIGTNIYKGEPVSRTVLSADGDTLAEIVTDNNAGLSVSLRIFDALGTLVAHLRHNQWAMPQRVFEVAKAPRRVVVRRIDGRETVFDIALDPRVNEVAIPFAHLYTPRRFEVIVDPQAGLIVRDPVNVRTVAPPLSDIAEARPISRFNIHVQEGWRAIPSA